MGRIILISNCGGPMGRRFLQISFFHTLDVSSVASELQFPNLVKSVPTEHVETWKE